MWASSLKKCTAQCRGETARAVGRCQPRSLEIQNKSHLRSLSLSLSTYMYIHEDSIAWQYPVTLLTHHLPPAIVTKPPSTTSTTWCLLSFLVSVGSADGSRTNGRSPVQAARTADRSSLSRSTRFTSPRIKVTSSLVHLCVASRKIHTVLSICMLVHVDVFIFGISMNGQGIGYAPSREDCECCEDGRVVSYGVCVCVLPRKQSV